MGSESSRSKSMSTSSDETGARAGDGLGGKTAAGPGTIVMAEAARSTWSGRLEEGVRGGQGMGYSRDNH